MKIIRLFQAKSLGNGFIIALIVADKLAKSISPSRMVIIGGSDKIARIPLVDKLCHGASGEYGNIIGMGLDCGQYFALMGASFLGLFNDHGLVVHKSPTA
jgi:hypothetical protein